MLNIYYNYGIISIVKEILEKSFLLYGGENYGRKNNHF